MEKTVFKMAKLKEELYTWLVVSGVDYVCINGVGMTLCVDIYTLYKPIRSMYKIIIPIPKEVLKDDYFELRDYVFGYLFCDIAINLSKKAKQLYNTGYKARHELSNLAKM